VSLSYRTGKPIEVRWEPEGAFYIAFGTGLQSEGWEKGLVGMKAGGRRELEIPERMANGHGGGSTFYVVDLVSVGPLEK
jgi:peptidylprolyl isomerase